MWPDAPRLVPDAALPASRYLGPPDPHPRRDARGSLFGHAAPAPGLAADRWRDDRTYLFGIDLYHQGYLWEAHEKWEAGFFAATAPGHRDLLQALIQLAAAQIQARRGRGAGVRILAHAVVRRLRSACEPVAAASSPQAGATDRTPTPTPPAPAPAPRLAGLDPRALLADVERHFAAALAAGTTDADAARTVGPPPRLEVGP